MHNWTIIKVSSSLVEPNLVCQTSLIYALRRAVGVPLRSLRRRPRGQTVTSAPLGSSPARWLKKYETNGHAVIASAECDRRAISWQIFDAHWGEPRARGISIKRCSWITTNGRYHQLWDWDSSLSSWRRTQFNCMEARLKVWLRAESDPVTFSIEHWPKWELP